MNKALSNSSPHPQASQGLAQSRRLSNGWTTTGLNGLRLRQEIDGLQARHLQLASCSHLLGWGEDGLQGGHSSLPAHCLRFLKQETNGLQDYIFMTRLLSIFQNLHLDIKTSNRNWVNNQTLDMFLLVIHLIHISVDMSIPISQFITPPPPLPFDLIIC